MNLSKSAYILALALTLFFPVVSFAQSRTTYVETVQYQQKDTLSLKVFFVQGRYTLDLDYMDNRRNLEAFVGQINELSPEVRIDTLKISGAASPEGDLDFNRMLSRKRAESIRQYVVTHTGGRPLKIMLDPQGENWAGLEEMLKGCTMPWAEEALRIVRGGPLYQTAKDGSQVDDRKKELQQLDEGRAWEWMLAHYFPELRRSAGGITCVIDRQVSIQRESSRDTLVISHKDTLVIINENFIEHVNQTGSSGTSVNLTLDHALSAVEFVTGSTIIPLTVNTLTLSGIRNSETCTFNNDAISWSATGSTVSYSFSPGTAVTENTAGTAIAKDANTFILIPQTITADAVELTLNVTPAGESTAKNVKCKLPAGTWAPGKKYTYKVNYQEGLLSISSSVTVTDWTSETAQDVEMNEE